MHPSIHPSMYLHEACLPLPLYSKICEGEDSVLFKNVTSVARIMPDPKKTLNNCLLTDCNGGQCAFYKVIRIVVSERAFKQQCLTEEPQGPGRGSSCAFPVPEAFVCHCWIH